MRLEVKEKVGSKWQGYDMLKVEGLTLREMFRKWAGQEVVLQTEKGLVCGTQHWVDYYTKRGKVSVLFPVAEQMMEQAGLRWALEEVIVPSNTLSVLLDGNGDGCPSLLHIDLNEKYVDETPEAPDRGASGEE